MTLSQEAKQKIKEEEQYRQEVREKYHQQTDNKPASSQKSSLLAWVLLIAILALFFVFAVLTTRYPSKTKPTGSNTTTQVRPVVGKFAFNKTNGVYRGQIKDLKPCSTNANLLCYVVEREGSSRLEEAPVDNTEVRNTR